MNVPLLREIQARILAEPDAFRMDTWTCGTAHCIGGWAVVLKGLAVENPDATMGAYQRVEIEGMSWSVMEVAADLLDIDREEEDENDTTAAERLFLVECWPPELEELYINAGARADGARIAADRIDHFIATEGRE